jgi:hypothetical protein
MRVLLSLCFVVVVGCEQGEATSRPESLQVTEPRFVVLAGPKKSLGESCDTGGASECESALCLKVSADSRLKGHVCSRPCSDSPCPSPGWRCAQVFPGEAMDFCVPEVSR